MRFLSVFFVTLCAATAAQAHGGDSSAAGFAHDLLHAIGGPNHLIALVGVGLLFLLIAVAPLLGKKLARSFAAARKSRLSRRG